MIITHQFVLITFYDSVWLSQSLPLPSTKATLVCKEDHLIYKYMVLYLGMRIVLYLLLLGFTLAVLSFLLFITTHIQGCINISIKINVCSLTGCKTLVLYLLLELLLIKFLNSLRIWHMHLRTIFFVSIID